MIVPNVIVCGNNTIDHVFVLGDRLAPNGKTMSKTLTRYAGGQAANVAHALGGLGVAVEYIGAFGDDAEGAAGRRSLQDVGVALSHTHVIHDCATHTAVVAVQPNGDRTIIMYKPEALRLTADMISTSAVAGATLLFVDNHEPEAALVLAIAARQRDVSVMADLEIADEAARRLLPHLTSLIAPLDVIAALAGKDDPGVAVRALRRGAMKCVVGTAGARGAWGFDGDDFVYVEAAKCSIQDTTGAGDAFHAAYIAAALRGAPFAEVLGIAAAIAAAKCEEPGPRLSTKRLEALRRQYIEGLPVVQVGKSAVQTLLI